MLFTNKNKAMDNSNRFERATVSFAPGLEVDGYRLPSGEFRVGMVGASTLLGFSKEWLGRVGKTNNKTLKALQDIGFKGLQESGEVFGQTGYQKVSTISLDDFSLLIIYATTQNKKEAIALQVALTKASLVDFFRDAFGQIPLTIEEKRIEFSQSYLQSLDWLEENRLDWAVIEDQEKFLAEGIN